MSSLCRSLVAALLATAFLLALPTTIQAGWVVRLDTSGLSTTSGFSYAIDYQFALGGSSTSNSVTISGITFGTSGGAGSSSTLTTSGAVTGDLQTQPISLSGMSGGFAEFTQGFTPGSTLQFAVNLTNFPQPGGADTFTFGILYSSGSTFDISNSLNIATTDLLSSSFLQLNTNLSGPVTVLTSTSTDTNFTQFQGATTDVTPTAAPAPSSLCLVLIGLLALIVVRRRS